MSPARTVWMLHAPDQPGSMSAVAWSPTGSHLAAVAGTKLVVWDMRARRVVRGFEGVESFSWSWDGDRLALVGPQGESLGTADLASGNVEGEQRPLEAWRFSRVAWRPHHDECAILQWRGERSQSAVVEIRKAGDPEPRWRHPLSPTGPSSRYAPRTLAWAPDGAVVVAEAPGHGLVAVDPATGKVLGVASGHTNTVNDIAWSPDGRTMVSVGSDRTILVWSCPPGFPGFPSGSPEYILEEHRAAVTSCSFSPDGMVLATTDMDGVVLLWSSSRWRSFSALTVRPPAGSTGLAPTVAFAPDGTLATAGGVTGGAVALFRYDPADVPVAEPARHYLNATVLLVGDSGVGKSGLGLRLSGQAFLPTESTHGRHIWLIDAAEVEHEDGSVESREVFLWDLAGQPGYRVVHQLHLSRADVAIVVFDARSEVDPFAGVAYWTRALEQSHTFGDPSRPRAHRLLVAARVDRGAPAASADRIAAAVEAGSFEGWFATSAKTGEGVLALRAAIDEAIRWDELPRVISSELLFHVKRHIVAEKEAGRLLATEGDLIAGFTQSTLTMDDEVAARTGADLLRRTTATHPDAGQDATRKVFESCIGRLEAQALVRRLSFGGFILLQPERLDAYAATVLNAARVQPDGLGSISEDDVLSLSLPDGPDPRITAAEHGLLLMATIEELLRTELAIREHTDTGPQLVFPSELTRDQPDAPHLPEAAVLYRFEGATSVAYATLVVRLSRSGLFEVTDMWRTAVQVRSLSGAVCGLAVSGDEGRAELGLYFSPEAGEETRRSLDDYVEAHLKRRALPESIERIQRYICSKCGEPLTDRQARLRLESGRKDAPCPVCDHRVPLTGWRERTRSADRRDVVEMNRTAQIARDQIVNSQVVQGKAAAGEYDVFLCHNADDKAEIRALADVLIREHGIRPWLDERELRPGTSWQAGIQRAFGQIRSAAVFVGTNGIGPWQDAEIEGLLMRFQRRRLPVIPVLLPDAPPNVELPLFLATRGWVDFRQTQPEPIAQLLWGITGLRPEERVVTR